MRTSARAKRVAPATQGTPVMRVTVMRGAPVTRGGLMRVVLGALVVVVGVTGMGRAQEPVVDPGRLRDALARYAHEPTVEELVAHVDDEAAFDPRVIRQLVRRARRSGWLPQIRVGMRRGRGQGLSIQLYDDRTRLATDDNLVIDATLTVRLDRVAYGPNEVALAREARARADARDLRARLVVAAYFERRRLQLERDLLGRHDVPTHLRIVELEALLDTFTSGAFSRILRSRLPARPRASPREDHETSP